MYNDVHIQYIYNYIYTHCIYQYGMFLKTFLYTIWLEQLLHLGVGCNDDMQLWTILSTSTIDSIDARDFGMKTREYRNIMEHHRRSKGFGWI